MTNIDLVKEAIQKQAAASPVADAVFHVFAQRQRARATVTVAALAQKMRKEGFSFPNSEYRKVLKFLADIKLGTPVTRPSGTLKGIKDIKVTLQSIGMAALTKEGLHQFHRPNKFEKIPVDVPATPATGATHKPERGLKVTLLVEVNNKSLSIVVPTEFNADDTAILIDKLKGAIA